LPNKLGFVSRQQVSNACNTLCKYPGVQRVKGTCAVCGKTRLVNMALPEEKCVHMTVTVERGTGRVLSRKVEHSGPQIDVRASIYRALLPVLERMVEELMQQTKAELDSKSGGVAE